MIDIKSILQKRKNYLEILKKKIEVNMGDFPQGTLRINNSGGKPRYYHRKETSESQGVYLKRGEYAIAQQLAQKDYCKQLYKAVDRELGLIQYYLEKQPVVSPEAVYDSLSCVRQSLILPIIETDEMFCKRWCEVNYEGKFVSHDIPELMTDCGERVRSKSELIIANLLAKEKIPYRYEYPVVLKDYGTVYPDFTVLNVRLRKEYYWEHFGMMDDSEYAEKAVRKIITYNMNNIFPGDKLILTYETKNIPINIRQIKKIIDYYFK